MSSFLTLPSIWSPTVSSGTYGELLLIFSFVWQIVAMTLHHTTGLRWQVTHKAWFSLWGWYSCFSRCLLVSRIYLPPFSFLSCIPCHSFLFSISSCPGNKSLRPLQQFVPSAITVLSSLLLLTIILHFPAFMRSPTLLEIFSTSSVISCMPICDVSIRAMSSA